MNLRGWWSIKFIVRFCIVSTVIITLLTVRDMKNLMDYKLIWKSFYPNHDCPLELTRLGRTGGGGKWVCGISEIQRKGEYCMVYSFGVGNDLSFERDLLGRTNCTLHIYDDTRNPKEFNSLLEMFKDRVTISRLGIGMKNSRNIRTLKLEMDSRGHQFLELLTMDVEGAEFDALEQIINDFSQRLPFRQLLVEIHLDVLPTNYFGVGIFKTFENWWRKLEAAGLKAIHNEPNHVCSSCYEFSFLNVRV